MNSEFKNFGVNTNSGNETNNKATNIYKQERDSLESQNKALIDHIKNIESQNEKMRETLIELDNAGKEKDVRLEQSTKLILNLRSKYNEALGDYQKSQEVCKSLEEELKGQKKTMLDGSKQKVFFDKLEKINGTLKTDLDKMKKDGQDLKTQLDGRNRNISELTNENKQLNLEIEELQAKLKEFEREAQEKNELLTFEKNKSSNLSNDLQKKDEEVKILIKMAQDLNNENKSNIDEVTKQSTSIVNMFYSNFSNKSSSQNNFLSYEKLLEMYSPSQFLPKNEIYSHIKDNKISIVLGDAISKEFVVPELFVNPKLNSTSIVSIPLEIFANLNLRTELLKSEMLTGYVREMQIVDFIEEKFNKKIIKILGKNTARHGSVTSSSGFNNPSTTKGGFNQNNGETLLEFFDSFVKQYMGLKEKIEELEGMIFSAQQENFRLKAINKENQEKMIGYEEQIASFKESINSVYTIFETKIDNFKTMMNQFVNAYKSKESRRKSYINAEISSKEEMYHKEIRSLQDEVALKAAEGYNLQVEIEKLKGHHERSRILDKSKVSCSKREKEKDDSSNIAVSLQDKDASLLEIELEKARADLAITVEKLNQVTVKLEDSNNQIAVLNSKLMEFRKKADKEIVSKDQLNMEVGQLKNDLSIAHERVVMSSNRLNTKLNQSVTNLNKSIDKSRSMSPDRDRGFNPQKSNRILNNMSCVSNKSLRGILSNKNVVAKVESIGFPAVKNNNTIKENNSVNSSNAHTFNYYSNLNESFNKESYAKKKNENLELRNEIMRLKEQNKALIKDINELEDNDRKKVNIQDDTITEKINEFRGGFKYSTFKELKRFYLDYQGDIDKISQKVDEVKQKFVQIEKNINSQTSGEQVVDKKVKSSYLKEVVSQMQKLIGLMNMTFSKYNKDIFYYSTNLKKAFDYISSTVFTTEDGYQQQNYPVEIKSTNYSAFERKLY